MTIQEANKYISTQLIAIYEQAEASNISDWLLENLTGIKRTDRIAGKGQSLSPERATQIDHYLQRLLAHEPVQYVLHEAWFCGLKFYVDRNVLIPRPETEEVVEWIISDCKFPIAKLTVMDVGRGSGCIPIAIKRRLGKAEVWGCDISPGALQVAKKNATTLGVDVIFIEMDFLNKERWVDLPTFDIIVSNPPYGVRLGEQQALAELYPKLGDVLKKQFTGWRAYFLSADMQLPKLIRLATSKRTPLFNGALDCRLFEYKMIEGGMRKKKPEPGNDGVTE